MLGHTRNKASYKRLIAGKYTNEGDLRALVPTSQQNNREHVYVKDVD
jgi:hypothetical protein